MTLLEDPVPYVAYEVPRHDRTAFVHPAIASAGHLLSHSRAAAAHWDLKLGEVPIAFWRAQARQELLEAAVRYTSAYRPYDGVVDPDRIVMAGHQPELFHPGVWFKNYALSVIGRDYQATAVNLVIDNDLRGSSSITVPTRTRAGVAAKTIEYDDPGLAVPFEQHRIANRDRFERFAGEVADSVRPWVGDPCVVPLWQHASEAIRRCGNIACAISSGRHALEASLGWQTLELPLSTVCRGSSFAAFVLALVTDLPRLHECYNSAVVHYRQAHRIRSSAHPVPLLRQQDGWWEVPLWTYDDARPNRRPVWVRSEGNQRYFSDREGATIQIPAHSEDPSVEPERLLLALQAANVKLRPRALVTTMYARLMLSDLFLHGIGGGKYDQLGDRIIERFFGVTAPPFMVLSATVMLPGIQRDNQHSEIARLRSRLRDVRFNPQRFADQIPGSSLLSEHETLRGSVPAAGQRGRWHRQISRLRDRLESELAPVKQRMLGELSRTLKAQKQADLLASREWPFCIYSTEMLVARFAEMLR